MTSMLTSQQSVITLVPNIRRFRYRYPKVFQKIEKL